MNDANGRESALITAIRTGDLVRLESLAASGAIDVDAADENGWTALCWAASRGNATAIDILARAGADVFKAGEDARTPYKIALAASHKEAADRLRKLEQAAGSDRERASSGAGEGRLYCKAYRVADLSRFPQWAAITSDGSIGSDEIVFLHQNYVVTRSIWHEKEPVLQNVTAEWRAFCEQDLGFKVPDDFDLMAV